MTAPLIIDAFAGGGGASTGIEWATGRSPDIAINHDATALAMHAANHPKTLHLTENVWKVNIDDHTRGSEIGLLWASPDCRHFSKARGGKPTSQSVRMLAWSIVKFCRDLKRNRPRVIIMENVEEFRTWEDYGKWRKALRGQGYRMKEFSLRACDYGAPTIRKRLFIVMRRDGEPIVKPTQTHAPPDSIGVQDGTAKPWRTAAEIIDWSLPCPSIFDTSEEIMAKHGLRAVRPLADNTLRRVAAGVQRYVIDAAEPFFVTYGQHGGQNRSSDDPIHTICASKKDTNAIVVPTLAMIGHGAKTGERGRTANLHAPISTTMAGGGKHALVAAFLAQHNKARGGVNPGRDARDPLSTLTVTGSQQAVVAAHLMTMKGSNRADGRADEPLGTVCAFGNHHAAVAAFMVKYYGAGVGQPVADPCHSVTTKDRFGLVTVGIDGQPWVITDIGLRMLTPRELFLAQGFPPEYEIERACDGTRFTKTDQTHKVGNSVSPVVAEALVRANCGFLQCNEWRTAA
ncbi:MAG: DNA cytosine methyltransferase [Pseudomonadota bacterium]